MNDTPMERVEASPQPSSNKLKLIVLAALLAGVGVIYWQFRDYLTLDRLAEYETSLRQFGDDHPILVYAVAFFAYVIVTGLSLPGATGMTLITAWYFGFVRGLILVSFASTTGATLAFLLSRYLLRDSIQSKFGDRIKSFNEALEREGAFYLFTLRLIPAVPFFVINVVMGLTKMRVATYWWVSQIGMLAGTIVYVYAGSQIPSLAQLADPSQLRASDIHWSEFANVLGGTYKVGEVSPRSAIAATFDQTQYEQLQTIAKNPEASDAEKQSLTSAINELIKQPEFALNANWVNAFPARDVLSSSEGRQAQKDITAVNRQLLVQAFPKSISPPRPILSKQLLLAFVILGLFPIAVKKLFARFKPS